MAGITSTKKIKGQPHLLAYITPNEVEKLKALGGQETMTPEGIPAYPEYDNYGYSSKADFDAGDRSKSNDPNVRRDSTFETYRGNKNIGVDLGLMSKYGTTKQKEEAQKALDKGQYYGTSSNQSFFEKLGTKRYNYNTNYKKKQLQRYQRDKINELNAKLKALGLDFYGDTNETYADFIGQYAPSITEFGPEGTGKYSQEFINDVLSGKRPPPESFSEIDISKVPGALTKGLAVGANFIGKKMAGPTTYEELMDIYSGNKTGNSYTGARDFDINSSTAKEMMKIFEPNRYAREYGPQEGGDGGNQQVYLPYEQVLPEEDYEREQKEFAYRFGDTQNVGADVTRASYIFNQGGRVPRAFGGIMDTSTGRRAYGLGSIFKSVGKAVGSVAKAAGKVLKSDFGKAAMLYAGGVYLGGGNIFSASAYNPANFLGKKGYLANIAGKALLKDPTKGFGLKDNLSMGKILGLSAVLPFIPGINKAPENEDIGMTERGGRLIDPLTGEEGTPASMRANIENAKIEAGGDPVKLAKLNLAYNNMLFSNLPYENYGTYAQGGRIRAQEGGLMNLGGMEKDYRNEGGFVPIGKAEKADDVPARLSVNEFVFTADAVRNAGGGDIDKGAEVMENMMKNLENGGRVSEESQGNAGAQEMFSVSERIGEVI